MRLDYAGLHLGRAAQRIHHTTELDEQAIPRRLDEPAVMFGDLRIDQLGSDSIGEILLQWVV
jgi:hypothetical protein